MRSRGGQGAYGSGIGVSKSASSFSGLFTRVEIGHIVISHGDVSSHGSLKLPTSFVRRRRSFRGADMLRYDAATKGG